MIRSEDLGRIVRLNDGEGRDEVIYYYSEHQIGDILIKLRIGRGVRGNISVPVPDYPA